jgi:aminoglycoside 2'-N-acetyltransferase I
MSLEIEILTGDAAWPTAKPLLDRVWPDESRQNASWSNITFAKPDLRVLVESDGDLVCHVGLYRREVTWNGRKLRAGGIGGVATHPDFRRQGLASIALDAAIHTFKDERATDFGLLFCEPHNEAFYLSRNWKPFNGEVYAEQAGARTRFIAMAPYVFYLKRAPHEGEIDLCGLPW